MAIVSKYKVNHPVYDCYKVSNVNQFIGYRVKLYLITDGVTTYTLYNQSDWIDNVNLMRENGESVTTFTYDMIVTPVHHHEIYKQIHDYVSSSRSD